MTCGDRLCGRSDAVAYVTLQGGVVLCGACWQSWTRRRTRAETELDALYRDMGKAAAPLAFGSAFEKTKWVPGGRKPQR